MANHKLPQLAVGQLLVGKGTVQATVIDNNAFHSINNRGQRSSAPYLIRLANPSRNSYDPYSYAIMDCDGVFQMAGSGEIYDGESALCLPVVKRTVVWGVINCPDHRGRDDLTMNRFLRPYDEVLPEMGKYGLDGLHEIEIDSDGGMKILRSVTGARKCKEQK